MNSTTPKTFKIITLGCRTNQYESQAYHNQLTALGLKELGLKEDVSPDICIVNTCTVTQSADKRSFDAIQKLAINYPKASIFVTGCFVDSNKDVPLTLKNLSANIQLVHNTEKDDLIKHIFPYEDKLPEFKINYFDAHTRAFVKIQDGCNSFCTYCIIPYVRGRSRSRKAEDIIAEIEGLIANGYKEVVLTGVNIGDFDGQGDCSLADLVRRIDQLTGLKRLRISSIDPDEVDEDLCQAVTEGKNTCPSMHIVLQSGSNKTLKRMNRKYTRQIFINTIARLKKHMKDFTVTTDVIYGFPGETASDFQDTLDLISELKIAKVHLFPYSKRPRTRAALYPNQVAPKVLAQRKAVITKAVEKAAFDLRQGYVGKALEVLVEYSDATHSYGHSANFLMVKINAILDSNSLVTVHAIRNEAEGLIAELL